MNFEEPEHPTTFQARQRNMGQPKKEIKSHFPFSEVHDKLKEPAPSFQNLKYYDIPGDSNYYDKEMQV